MITAASATGPAALDVELRDDLLYVGHRLVRMIRDHHQPRVILRELADQHPVPEPDDLNGMGENLGVVNDVDTDRPILVANTKHAGWAAQDEHRTDLERAAAHYFRGRP